MTVSELSANEGLDKVFRYSSRPVCDAVYREPSPTQARRGTVLYLRVPTHLSDGGVRVAEEEAGYLVVLGVGVAVVGNQFVHQSSLLFFFVCAVHAQRREGGGN